MNKYIIYFAFIFFSFVSVKVGWGQETAEYPEIIPPSPQAAAFTKYADIPVNTYNGIPNINIPLYTIQSRDITIPISLSYHASGIKVNEEASWVGLGWTLNAGGVISRNVMGLDDFKFNGSTAFGYFTNTIPEIPVHGFLEDGEPQIIPYRHQGAQTSNFNSYLQKGCKLFFINRLAASGDPIFPEVDIPVYTSDDDFEPDQYSFSIAGNTGKFILDRSKNIILEKQGKIAIEVLDDQANSWRITTEDGFVYTFAEYESTSETGGSPYIKTAWYLTEIKSPKTSEKVTFHYTKVTSASNAVQTIGAVSERLESLGNCDPAGYSSNASTVRYYDKIILDYIDFSNGQIRFITSSRTDIKNDVKLDKMQVFKKDNIGNIESQPFKEYTLKSNYFEGSIDKESNWPASSLGNSYFFNRLRLDTLEETAGSLSKGIHRFEYYQTSNMPAKNSFARDYWGYYNGRSANTSLIPAYKGVYLGNRFDGTTESFLVDLPGADRNPNPSFTNIFSLKKIHYPTKGYTEFEYENHTFDADSSQVNDRSPIGFLPELVERYFPFFYDASPVGNDLGIIREYPLDVSDAYVYNTGTVELKLDAVFRFSTTRGDASDFNSSSVYIELYNASGGRISKVTLDLLDDVQQCEDPTNSIECECSSDASVCIYRNTYLVTPGVYTVKIFIANSVQGFTEIKAGYKWTAIAGASNETGIITTSPITTAGGLRIKEIIDHDGENPTNNIVRKFIYHYKEDKDNDGIEEEYSFGRRMSRPIHEHYEHSYKQVGGTLNGNFYDFCPKFVRTSSSNIPLNGTAGGSVVGYDQVTVLHGKDDANNYGIFGSTVYQYENMPDRILNYDYLRQPGIPNLSSNRNGLLKKQIDYDRYNNPVKEIINQYNKLDNANEAVYYVFRPLVVQFWADPLLQTCADIHLSFIYPAIHSEWIQLLSTTETIYDQNDPTKSIETVTAYEYNNPTHLQVTKTTSRQSKKSGVGVGQALVREYTYPADPGSGAPAEMWDATHPNYRHMHSQVLEQTTKVGTAITGKTETTYGSKSNHIVPIEVQTYPNGVDAAPKVNYDYDSNGNVIEVQRDNDVPTTYLWGYNNTLPVAKIVGASYNQVEAALGGASVVASLNTLDNQALRNALNVLRSALPLALVTTYTYDPLRGMTSATSPNNKTITYEYDDFGRLKATKDHEGNVVQSNEYHYKQSN